MSAVENYLQKQLSAMSYEEVQNYYKKRDRIKAILNGTAPSSTTILYDSVSAPVSLKSTCDFTPETINTPTPIEKSKTVTPTSSLNNSTTILCNSVTTPISLESTCDFTPETINTLTPIEKLEIPAPTKRKSSEDLPARKKNRLNTYIPRDSFFRPINAEDAVQYYSQSQYFDYSEKELENKGLSFQMYYRHHRQIINQTPIDDYDDFWSGDDARAFELWESTKFVINPFELRRSLMSYNLKENNRLSAFKGLIEIRALERASIVLSRSVSGRGQIVVGDLLEEQAEELFKELEASAPATYQDSSYRHCNVIGKKETIHCIKRTWIQFLPKLQHTRWNFHKFRHPETGMIYRIFINRLSLIYIPIIFIVRMEIGYTVEVHDGYKWKLI